MIVVATKLASASQRLLSMVAHLCGRLLAILVAVQFAIVVARYLVATNFLWLQELAVYMHAAIIMLAAAWGLVCNKHVRIDVFWGRFGPTGKRRIEWIGTLALLVPMAGAVFFTSLPYVVQSWSVSEGSTEVSGLPGLFLLKSLLPIFAVLLLVAGLLRLWRLHRG